MEKKNKYETSKERNEQWRKDKKNIKPRKQKEADRVRDQKDEMDTDRKTMGRRCTAAGAV